MRMVGLSSLQSCYAALHLRRWEEEGWVLGETGCWRSKCVLEASFLPPDSLCPPALLPVPPCCLKPFAPQPSQGVFCPSPSYTTSKLLFFLFSFATASFGEHSPSQQFTLRGKGLHNSLSLLRLLEVFLLYSPKLEISRVRINGGYFEPRDSHSALKSA